MMICKITIKHLFAFSLYSNFQHFLYNNDIIYNKYLSKALKSKTKY